MNEVTPFTFPATGQRVRVIADGEPRWVAADVCAVLAIANPSDALASLDDDEKAQVSLALATGYGKREQVVNVVNEAGLYSLILRSRKPEAKAFKRWVTHEVLPQIRRTGGYSVAELSRRDLARMVIEEADRADAAEQRAAELSGPAEAWNTLAEATGDYSVREAAQILDRDPAINTGQNRLFASLREFGWIDRKGVPYQTQVDLGRIVQRPTSYTHPHKGEPVLTSQIRITAKGIEALRKLLGGGDEGHLFAVPGGA